jgi:hypothetical protein
MSAKHSICPLSGCGRILMVVTITGNITRSQSRCPTHGLVGHTGWGVISKGPSGLERKLDEATRTTET